MPPKKRLNRKNIIKTLEATRQSLDSAIGLLLQYEDVVMASSLKVSHNRVNDLIVELGGESYPETFLDYYTIEKFKLNANKESKKKTVHWTYEGREIKSIQDCEPNALGFIYEITNITKNKRYLGRKTIMKPKYTSGVNKGKSKGTYPFISYCGSSKSLLEDIKNGDEYKKEIIRWCFSKAELTYYESQAIYCSNSLLDENYYNFWCKSTVYSKHLNPSKKDLK